jgi:hypothetical protein
VEVVLTVLVFVEVPVVLFKALAVL